MHFLHFKSSFLNKKVLGRRGKGEKSEGKVHILRAELSGEGCSSTELPDLGEYGELLDEARKAQFEAMFDY